MFDILQNPTINDLTPFVFPFIISIIFFCILLIATVWIRRAVRRWRFGNRNEVVKYWKAVEDLLKRGDATSYRLALIQADAVLDVALKAKAFPGTTTGERLSFATKKYPNLRNTFWARSLRNRLVHEAGIEIKTGEIQRAVAELRRALVTLGAL